MKPNDLPELSKEEEYFTRLFGLFAVAFFVAMLVALGSFGAGLLWLNLQKAVGLSIFTGTLFFVISLVVYARDALKPDEPK